MAEEDELLIQNQFEWQAWLDQYHDTSTGIWLILAKKQVTTPTGLTYEQALTEALCYGWIDGQLRSRDSLTFTRRFTPRKVSSTWSKRNVETAIRLIREGSMHRAGLDAIERAKKDGSWEHAYQGQANIDVPSDFVVALQANSAARDFFEQLSRANRYAILYRLDTAKRAEVRARRIEQFVSMLERGETIHPQR